ncbi:MAG: tRNA uridine-5-carboxymethylaminomethyl(34) synthesis enzyme MnmG [Elusimicrobiota bacterium]
MTKHSVIVIGAGHAGCEAALASARMGLPTLLLTMDLKKIALMSCNPAIGGIAKGQIVREIDALGGEMAKITDATGLQFRTLNLSKGPAVQSPRAQCDRLMYNKKMTAVVISQKNLSVKEEEVTDILTGDIPLTAKGVMTKSSEKFYSDAVIVTTGTFLNGLMHIGLKSFSGGRIGEKPATGLTGSLKSLGFKVGRLKTGTPPRLDKKTIDYTKLTLQHGDYPPKPFSHFTKELPFADKQLPCWITYTNSATHDIIRKNLNRSPLYTGIIKGTGPRYCPSIEDKVMRFADRDRHQVFLEPEGFTADEIYCNGISTSLPEDVQEQIVHSMDGCGNAKILKFGYAVEYDWCDPTQLKPTLETKAVENLFFAGQINGTTGYEEAAAQGIIAGINAALKLKGKSHFILGRDEAYIGVLIDDLVTKGVLDPYRMFTSRAEFRLVLRSDNADLRLMDYGHRFGLVSNKSYEKFCKYREALKQELKLSQGNGVARLIRRGMSYKEAAAKMMAGSKHRVAGSGAVPTHLRTETVNENYLWTDEKIERQLEIEIKYAGYIQRQGQQIEKFKKLENKKIPAGFNYEKINGLLKEARQKLILIKPRSIGQASRISGVTPSDVSILLVHLMKYEHEKGEKGRGVER